MKRLIGGRKHAEAYSRHAVGLGDGFDDDKMRVRIEYRLVDERVVLLIREIGKGFVGYHAYSLGLAPVRNPQQLRLSDIISAGIVGIYQDEHSYILVLEKLRHVVSVIGKILILRPEADNVIRAAAVRVLLKGRPYASKLALMPLDKVFDKLRPRRCRR